MNRSSLIWFSANICGVGLFLAVGSALWPTVGLDGCGIDSGYGFTALLAWPALMIIGAAVLASAVVAASSWSTNYSRRVVAVSALLLLALATAYDLHRTFGVNC